MSDFYMSIARIIFQPIITFMLVASFSLFFMQLFFIAGILSTKIQRMVVDDADESANLRNYTAAAFGGLVSGSICLLAMMFL